MNKTFRERSEKVLKLIALYAVTLMAYPVAFWFVFMFMSPSIDGRGTEISAGGPFFLSSIAVCVVNVLLYRNIFGKGRMLKAILLNGLVIALCMMLGKMDLLLFTIYNKL